VSAAAGGLRTARVQLLAVIRKELRQTIRDRRVMFLLIVAPLLQTVIFGFAIDFQVDRVPTALADLDGSAASREHARRLLADGTLRSAHRASSAAEADRMLEQNRAAAALLLPPGFGADLGAGRPARLQVLVDGTDPNQATVAAGAASRYFGELGQRLARERGAAAGRPLPGGLQATPRIAYNPSLRSAPFMVPGVLVMVLLIITTIVTAMGLSREREMGTLEQVMVTPIRPLTLLLGKLVPFAAIGLFDVLLVLTAGAWIFDLPFRGPLLVLGVATLLYLIVTLSLGLLISTVSRTQQQSFLAGFLVLQPALLLSGVATPIRSMPAWLQAVTLLNPVRWFIEVVRANLLKGAGFGDLWPRMLILLVLGLGLLATATMRFRKRMQ
jgi:ABC-2 type transport system permease protein